MRARIICIQQSGGELMDQAMRDRVGALDGHRHGELSGGAQRVVIEGGSPCPIDGRTGVLDAADTEPLSDEDVQGFKDAVKELMAEG